MQNREIYFNTFFLILITVFFAGIFWLWRNEVNSLNIQDIQVVKDINVIKIEAVENKKKKLEMNLAVPFTSQAPEKIWTQPWQDACEEATVLMLDAYYKGYKLSPLLAKDELIKMVKWEESKGWGLSIEIEKIKELAEYYVGQFDPSSSAPTSTLNFKIIDNPTVADIKQSIDAGQPVLVVAYGKTLPNPHFRNGGPEYHTLIISGYTETHFITNDPGTQFGQNFQYRYDVLLRAIHDWNGGKVKKGMSKILIRKL